MIKYNLICARDHEFEGWFRDGATYDAQSEAGEISCPSCGMAEVRKAPMAPSVVSSKRAGERPSQEMADLRQALISLRQQIESSATDVGERFPEEARRMHYGETEEKPIYGQASADERESLRDEGIDVVPIPWIPAEN
ncbi:MAG TPA: DUF1178 family protein [Candidatus Sulfotelmatobacter sp.]|nr:DUF1178 family protein [Candidatus Sulfotelmatobacter sp.]